MADVTGLGMNPSQVFPSWFERQSLKSVTVPDYSPESHRISLNLLGDGLARDRTIAGGKLSGIEMVACSLAMLS